MKIELDKSLPLPVPASIGWDLLTNIEGIAACMPGAKITERIDETHYRGTITVKLGPATVSFKGEIEIAEQDGGARSMRLIGRGSDTGGGSGASLDLKAQVVETGPGTCEFSGRSEVTVTGKIAAFGGRLMNTVTDQLLKIFFANLLAQAQAVAPAPVDVAPVAASAVETQPIIQPAPVQPAPPQEVKFDALGFAWAVVKSFFAGLLGRPKTS